MLHMVLMAMSSVFPTSAQVPPPVVPVPVPVTSTAAVITAGAPTAGRAVADSSAQALGDGSGHFDPVAGTYETLRQFQARQAVAHAGESRTAYSARLCVDLVALKPWLAGSC